MSSDPCRLLPPLPPPVSHFTPSPRPLGRQHTTLPPSSSSAVTPLHPERFLSPPGGSSSPRPASARPCRGSHWRPAWRAHPPSRRPPRSPTWRWCWRPSGAAAVSGRCGVSECGAGGRWQTARRASAALRGRRPLPLRPPPFAPGGGRLAPRFPPSPLAAGAAGCGG